MLTTFIHCIITGNKLLQTVSWVFMGVAHTSELQEFSGTGGAVKYYTGVFNVEAGFKKWQTEFFSLYSDAPMA